MFDSFATPWNVACQAPLSMRLSRQGHWNGLPFPPPGDLPNPGIKPMSPALAGGFFTLNHLRSPYVFIGPVSQDFIEPRPKNSLTRLDQTLSFCYISRAPCMPPNSVCSFYRRENRDPKIGSSLQCQDRPPWPAVKPGISL